MDRAEVKDGMHAFEVETQRIGILLSTMLGKLSNQIIYCAFETLTLSDCERTSRAKSVCLFGQ